MSPKQTCHRSNPQLQKAEIRANGVGSDNGCYVGSPESDSESESDLKACGWCGIRLKLTAAKYCSRDCYALSRRVPIEDRFWSKVNKNATTGCWLWTAAVLDGYGQVRDGKHVRAAHRVAWEMSNGRSVPASRMVCHSCDTPLCVNPAHLFIGTQFDNMQDCAAKSRLVQQRRAHHPHPHPLSVVSAMTLSGIPLRGIV